MSRLRLAGLALTLLLVLVLVGSLVWGMIGGGEGGGAVAPVAGTAGERVRVEVLNAAGIPGLARTVTERLRDSGFDVVYYGNATGFGRDSSMVLDRVGKLDLAQRVARAVDVARVETRVDSTLYLDVTVVVGRDWSGIEREAEPDSTPR